MKKAICILLALLMLTGTLAGCGKNDAAETTEATTAVETTAEEATTLAPVLTDEQILALPATEFGGYLYNMNVEGLTEGEAIQKKAELTARQFLNYIKTKRVEDIAYFTSGRYETPGPDSKVVVVTNEAYMVFNKIDVESYEIFPSFNSSYDFTVILHITKSSSELFPEGTSRWRLTIVDEPYEGPYLPVFVGLFSKTNDTSVSLGGNPSVGNAVEFCYDVSTNLGCFETMDDFNNMIPDAETSDVFNWFCDSFVSTLLYNRDGYYSAGTYPAKRSELEALAKKTFGITDIDFKKYNLYNTTDDTIGSTGHGGIVNSALLANSTYDQSTRIRTVIIDYYSDAAYLLKAKTMKYTLRENTDGSLTLLSTRLVYDSGYEMYSFGM